MRCPKCKSKNIKKNRSIGFLENLEEIKALQVA